MKVRCSNCKNIYDTEIDSYEDHEASKCIWTNEDKKDYHYGFLSMFLFIGGLFGGMIAVIHTNNFLYMIVISLPTLILSQLIMYRVWTKSITSEIKSCEDLK